MAEGGFGVAPRSVPEAGTIGGTSSPAEEIPEKQTVFDEETFVPKRPGRRFSVNATTERVQQASIWLFIVAGVSLVEALFFGTGNLAMAASSGVVAIVFGILGAMAFRLHKAAFLAGILIYAAETLQLLVHGWNNSMIEVVYGIVAHCAIIYRLYLAYGMICDLETEDV